MPPPLPPQAPPPPLPPFFDDINLLVAHKVCYVRPDYGVIKCVQAEEGAECRTTEAYEELQRESLWVISVCKPYRHNLLCAVPPSVRTAHIYLRVPGRLSAYSASYTYIRVDRVLDLITCSLWGLCTQMQFSFRFSSSRCS